MIPAPLPKTITIPWEPGLSPYYKELTIIPGDTVLITNISYCECKNLRYYINNCNSSLGLVCPPSYFNVTVPLAYLDFQIGFKYPGKCSPSKLIINVKTTRQPLVKKPIYWGNYTIPLCTPPKDIVFTWDHGDQRIMYIYTLFPGDTFTITGLTSCDCNTIHQHFSNRSILSRLICAKPSISYPISKYDVNTNIYFSTIFEHIPKITLRIRTSGSANRLTKIPVPQLVNLPQNCTRLYLM